MISFLAAIRGADFGLGTTEMAAVETQMVLFLLGVFFGVLLLGGLFVYLSWRQGRFPSLPPETEELLRDLERENTSGYPARTSEKGESPNDPWERPDDWWKSPK